jgi:hypothetical protein
MNSRVRKFAVALITVTCVSTAVVAIWLWGSRLAGAHIAKADVPSAHLTETRVEATPPTPSVTPEPPVLSTPSSALPTEAPAPVHERILIFGDSMVINMVARLSEYCAGNGHKLFPAISYGSTTLGWAYNKYLDQLLKLDDPTLIIVVVGSSELTSPQIARHEQFVRLMLKKLEGRRFVWIGPANWRPDTGINDLILRMIGPERFFRSAELSLPREGDGIHPTPNGGRKWVDAFVSWMPNSLAPETFSAPPLDGAPKVQSTILPAAYKTPATQAAKH